MVRSTVASLGRYIDGKKRFMASKSINHLLTEGNSQVGYPQPMVLSSFQLYLQDLADLIRQRINQFFKGGAVVFPTGIPSLRGEVHPFGRFIEEQEISVEEYMLLILALAPHIQPQFLDEQIRQHLPSDGDFPQLGGARGKHFRGFLPTGETALFLLGGIDDQSRVLYSQLFSPDHRLVRQRIISLEEVAEGEPLMAGRIILSQEYVELFTQGQISRPRFSLRFPAQLIETKLAWDDLILNADTLSQIRDLEAWLKHGTTLMEDWQMGKKLKPGYRVLFHGPPGTGKTLTASLLGRYTQRDVYKVDLSMVVSKFIGETEKNLANLFAKAENKDWILFFDEADALFGKRTNVRDAHDKYANQEVSYLLQRVEGYNGLVILATNFKNNIDSAFIRRFQSIIHFPIPAAPERLRLWQNGFPAKAPLGPKVDLGLIAQRYELSGAEIINVVQYCCLKALDRHPKEINQEDILFGIRREFQKEGKIMR